MKTENAINELMNKFNNWNMLESLTEGEKQSIKQDLLNIAGVAIMEAHNKIQNILPSFYNELTK